MKFITEEDLRGLFRKEPFTTYRIKVGERLTPGGRQFLSDRGISMITVDDWVEEETDDTNHQLETLNLKDAWRKKVFDGKMRSMEALFLITAEELLSKDVLLAQKVIQLGEQFTNIKKDMAISTDEAGAYNGCIGILQEDFSKDLGDCFEITAFHIQLEKGREIILLHRLRCGLRELEPFVLELFENNDDKKVFCQEVIGKVNQSINTISQMICSIFGGKICQRKC